MSADLTVSRSSCGLPVLLTGWRWPRTGRVTVRGPRSSALFECKQSRPDLDRDSAQTASIEIELRALQERRQILERLLAVHYPHLRIPNSLFPEWDPFDP